MVIFSLCLFLAILRITCAIIRRNDKGDKIKGIKS